MCRQEETYAAYCPDHINLYNAEEDGEVEQGEEQDDWESPLANSQSDGSPDEVMRRLPMHWI